ncbi:MAG: sigma-70 family RNA polymerase sigma factor [Ignavibacteriales bacterium]|nr:sigma-70 family RNA polymerase sigma factor [Ignavibacteriales bacterium]
MISKDKSVTELFNSYSNDVLNYSMSILKDHDEAKDAVQEVFIRYIKNEENFRGDCSYKTWLLTITRNYCLKKLNGRSSKTETLDDNFIEANESSIETKISLNDALDKLTAEEYELIYLRDYECHTYHEMALILGVTVDNIKVKLFRVRKHLRKYLE